jgi:hypothetical protein
MLRVLLAAGAPAQASAAAAVAAAAAACVQEAERALGAPVGLLPRGASDIIAPAREPGDCIGSVERETKVLQGNDIPTRQT